MRQDSFTTEGTESTEKKRWLHGGRCETGVLFNLFKDLSVLSVLSVVNDHCSAEGVRVG